MSSEILTEEKLHRFPLSPEEAIQEWLMKGETAKLALHDYFTVCDMELEARELFEGIKHTYLEDVMATDFFEAVTATMQLMLLTERVARRQDEMPGYKEAYEGIRKDYDILVSFYERNSSIGFDRAENEALSFLYDTIYP